MEQNEKRNPLPLYNQLVNIIINRMEEGMYDEHDKLPSERELCKQFDVSRITVRQALQELEKAGYIYKEHGKGTYVAPKKYGQQLFSVYSFTEEMKRSEKNSDTKVLSFERIQPGEKVMHVLGFKATEEINKVTRLWLANNIPLLYELSYLPVILFPGRKSIL